VLLDIAVDGDGRDLVLLRDWLIANPSIRRTATVSLTARAAVPGAMGAAADLITIVAGTALDLGSLLVAIAAWLRPRPTVTTVTIRRGDVEVTITGADRAALDEARKRLEDGEN
jgi:hypothetical protein